MEMEMEVEMAEMEMEMEMMISRNLEMEMEMVLPKLCDFVSKTVKFGNILQNLNFHVFLWCFTNFSVFSRILGLLELDPNFESPISRHLLRRFGRK